MGKGEQGPENWRAPHSLIIQRHSQPVLDADRLGEEELRSQLQARLDALKARLDHRTQAVLGYPAHHDREIDYSPLRVVEAYNMNNVGDPFQQTNYGVHTQDFELGVIAWFAALWGLDLDEAWGYVTSGGTESNIQAVLLARETLPDALLYFSTASHYSVQKAAMLLRVGAVEVAAQPNGEIDYGELTKLLREHSDRPAILCLNMGTTVEGAVDDPSKAVAALKEAGFSRERFYIHCDGALAGIMLPFMEGAPLLSFRDLPIDSISVSGHKFLGTPAPCGIIIARRRYLEPVGREVEYIFTKDVTLTGSRSGHTPLLLWYTLSLRGRGCLRRQVQGCLELARNLKALLDSHGIPAWLNPWSTTVLFERPRDEAFIREWQLACQGDWAHVVVMPSLREETLQVFVKELARNRSELLQLECKQEGPHQAQQEPAQQQQHRPSIEATDGAILAQQPQQAQQAQQGPLQQQQQQQIHTPDAAAGTLLPQQAQREPAQQQQAHNPTPANSSQVEPQSSPSPRTPTTSRLREEGVQSRSQEVAVAEAEFWRVAGKDANQMRQ